MLEVKMKKLLVLLVVFLAFAACSKTHEGIVSEEEMSKTAVKTGIKLNDGKIEMLGYYTEPRKPRHGEPFKLVSFWRFKEQIPEGYQLFFHFESEDGEERFTADHEFLDGRVKELALGKIIKDVTNIEKLPLTFDTDTMFIRGGFFKDKERLVPEDKFNDGKNRAKIGSIKITKPNIMKKQMEVYVIAGNSRSQTKIDGLLDESYWLNSSKDDKFWLPDGSELSPVKTTVMAVMDHKYLYIGFIADDNDIYAELKNNDDPLYDHDDVVEIFIDPTGKATPYYEIQVSAAGVKFDSKFSGGRRKNRDDSWDSGIVYGVSLNGTLNESADKDHNWIAEIAIPWKSIVKEPPKDGDKWKVFFHRINRHSNGRKPQKGDFSSWTPPYSGDFHNIKYMGELVFVYEEIL